MMMKPISIVHMPTKTPPQEQKHEPPPPPPPPPPKVNAKRLELARLRRRLTEPCALQDRDLLTLLAYAVGGDGDPIVGLLDDARATIGMMGEGQAVPVSTEPNLVASLERRLAVALELYSRATAEDQ